MNAKAQPEVDCKTALLALPPKPPTFSELAILCPHLTVVDDAVQEGWRLAEGAIINLDGGHNLALCEQCWHVVQSHVAQNYVRIYAKAQRA